MTALREQCRFGASVARAARGPVSPSVRRRRPRTVCAFTLVELLIAIAILGVGITMAAALFPTAIKQNERSANDTIGMIVAKNALGVVKARLTAGGLTPGLNDTELMSLGPPPGALDPNYLDQLTAIELAYPVPREPRDDFMEDADEVGGDWWEEPPTGSGNWHHKALRGAVVLGREMTPGANDFQLVIVSFAKDPIHHNQNRVIPQRVSGNVFVPPNSDVSVFMTSDMQYLQRAGVVIFADGTLVGTFARITATQGNQAILDRDVIETGAADAWLIVERYDTPPLPPAPNVVGAWSPVTSVLVTRTALRDQ